MLHPPIAVVSLPVNLTSLWAGWSISAATQHKCDGSLRGWLKKNCKLFSNWRIWVHRVSGHHNTIMGVVSRFQGLGSKHMITLSLTSCSQIGFGTAVCTYWCTYRCVCVRGCDMHMCIHVWSLTLLFFHTATISLVFSAHCLCCGNSCQVQWIMVTVQPEAEAQHKHQPTLMLPWSSV